MKKHKWAIIAGVCVVAVIVVGAVFIPRLFSNPSTPPAENTNWVVVMPGHWWKTSLDQQQIEILHDMWGTDVNIRQLVEALWPSVLKELPAEAITLWENQDIQWPSQTFDKWKGIQYLRLSLSQKGAMFDIYVGCTKCEDNSSFRVWASDGIKEESRYRVSMYTDEVLASPW